MPNRKKKHKKSHKSHKNNKTMSERGKSKSPPDSSLSRPFNISSSLPSTSEVENLRLPEEFDTLNEQDFSRIPRFVDTDNEPLLFNHLNRSSKNNPMINQSWILLKFLYRNLHLHQDVHLHPLRVQEGQNHLMLN